MTNHAAETTSPEFPAVLLEYRPSEFLRRTSGRETFAWKDLDASACAPGSPVVPAVIVKRTRSRPLLRNPARDVRPGGRREHDNLVALRADGLPVPRAITWCEERGGLLRRPARSVVVMEKIEHRETLRERLARAGEVERGRWSRELARIVALLHARGWRHRDLYLQHFLIPWPEHPGAPRLVLIDVGRARRERRLGRRWMIKDLAALHLSAPESVLPRERIAFLCRYLSARGLAARGGIDRGERRALVRKVDAKAARMRAHVPRDERPG